LEDLYRAIDRDGAPADVMVSEHRSLAAAERFFRSAKVITGLITRPGRDGRPRRLFSGDLDGAGQPHVASDKLLCQQLSRAGSSWRRGRGRPAPDPYRNAAARCGVGFLVSHELQRRGKVLLAEYLSHRWRDANPAMVTDTMDTQRYPRRGNAACPASADTLQALARLAIA